MSREAKKTCSTQQLFFECAELFLPWLSPSDLASASSACKTLHCISKSITTRRASDASRNFEKHPIPFINTIDSQPYSYFIYTPSQILCSPPLSQPWGSNLQKPISNLFSSTNFGPYMTSLLFISATDESTSGCVCKSCSEEEDDGENGCPCSRFKPKVLLGLGQDLEMMTECGPSCDCGVDCGNRLTQRGVSIRLKIFKDERKGWGLYAAQFLPRGEFICEYAGELLTTQEARKRQKKYDELALNSRFSAALLVVREHLPSGKACLRINIDATRVGNIARFINHSCDGGNLTTVLVRNSGALLPRLCFFASRDIVEGEELAFSYGEVRIKQNGLQCFCGSSGCLGALPSEQT
ncbi:SET domain [Macleaya cordata]|uniref:SET domain n=1 Tax=Macleaya cordata TaxID=56857 RepID=A0A200PRS1_MACCD|nr:SET domain [Macleaya cordata]